MKNSAKSTFLAIAALFSAVAGRAQQWNQGNPSNQEQFALCQINLARANANNYLTQVAAIAASGAEPPLVAYFTYPGNSVAQIETNYQAAVQTVDTSQEGLVYSTAPLAFYPLFYQQAATLGQSSTAQTLAMPTAEIKTGDTYDQPYNLSDFPDAWALGAYAPATTSGDKGLNVTISGPNATGGTAVLTLVSPQTGNMYPTNAYGDYYALPNPFMTPRELVVSQMNNSFVDLFLQGVPIATVNQFTTTHASGHARLVGLNITPGPTSGESILTFFLPNTEDLTTSDLPFGQLTTVFITGVAYQDTNLNGQYDPGEGIANVKITTSAGTWYAVTSASGGYSIPVPANVGPVTVTASNSALSPVTVMVGSDNVEADFVILPAVALPPASPPTAGVTPTGSISFTVVPTINGSVIPTYQWQVSTNGGSTWTNLSNGASNGASYSGATTTTLTVTNPALTLNGSEYRATATIGTYSADSTPSTLTVENPPTATTTTKTLPVNAGDTLRLQVTGSGGTGQLTYAWYLNGSPIGTHWYQGGYGLLNGPVVDYANTGPTDAGTYTVVVTDELGVSSNPITVATVNIADNSWLMNLSSRAYVANGAILDAGFVTTGPAAKNILIRGVGPSLTGFGVTNALQESTLTFYNSASVALATTSNWAPSLASLFSAVGAFALQPGSTDAAFVQNVTPGAYTSIMNPTNGVPGVGLIELYDADAATVPPLLPGPPTSRMVNISARADVQGGGNVLIGGFVFTGTTSGEFLIRGVGPTLANFGVSGVLAQPTITLYDSSSNVIATNTGWGNAIQGAPSGATESTVAATEQLATADIMASVGAFALPAGSADCAIVVTLPPGQYTAILSGINGATGVGLVEIYEIR